MTIATTRHKPGHLEGAPNRQDLYDAINRLTEYDRVLLHSLFWDAKTFGQVAEETFRSRQAVQKQLKRVLRDLRSQLAIPEDAPPPPPTLYEEEILHLAARVGRRPNGHRYEYPPIRGWVRGKTIAHKGGAWGAPTWRCGGCSSTHPVSRRTCGCLISPPSPRVELPRRTGSEGIRRG